MEPRTGRIALLIASAFVAFAVVSAGLLALFPGPRKDTDYLVIGTLGTFSALGTIFAVVVTGALRGSGGVFFKRRRVRDA